MATAKELFADDIVIKQHAHDDTQGLVFENLRGGYDPIIGSNIIRPVHCLA